MLSFIKNLTITEQIGYLALAAFVCAVIFIALYFAFGIPKYIKAAKERELANKKAKEVHKNGL